MTRGRGSSPAGRPLNDEPMTGCDRTVRYGAAYGVWYAGKVTNAGPASPRWGRRFLCSIPVWPYQASRMEYPCRLLLLSPEIPCLGSILKHAPVSAQAPRRYTPTTVLRRPSKCITLSLSWETKRSRKSGWMTLACHMIKMAASLGHTGPIHRRRIRPIDRGNRWVGP